MDSVSVIRKFGSSDIRKSRNADLFGNPEIQIVWASENPGSRFGANPDFGTSEKRLSGFPDIRRSEFPHFRYRIHATGNFFQLQIQIPVPPELFL